MSLYVGELSEALGARFSSEAASSNTSGGKCGLWFWSAIYESQATSNLIKNLFSSWGTKNWASQAIASTVCQFNSVFFIFSSEKLKDRAEKLFIPSLIWTFDDSDGEEGGFHLGSLPGDFIWLRKAFDLISKALY